MPNIDKDVQKDAVKEALKEWLNDQFAMFGKFSAMGIVSLIFAALAYLFLSTHGWTK